jgi:hypothetical protein
MALESTQPLSEMSTRNLPGGRNRPAPRADNLTAICEPNVWKCGSLNLLQGLHDMYRDTFTLPFTIVLCFFSIRNIRFSYYDFLVIIFLSK